MQRLRLAILVIASSLTVSTTVRADNEGDKLAAILKSRSEPIVTVRFVLEAEFRGQKREIRSDMRGAVVDASGLIVISRESISSPNAMMKVTPVEFKVVIGKEEKEYDAFIAAKDTKLGLTFLQIRDLGDRKLVGVDFDGVAKPTIGQKVVSVNRMSKGFDFAPYFSVGRVIGRIKKPRKAWVTNLNTALALPIYSLDGQLVGFMGAIDPSGEGGVEGVFILPAKVVKGLIRPALAQAAERLAEVKEETPKKDQSDENGKTEDKKKSKSASDADDGSEKSAASNRNSESSTDRDRGDVQ